MRNYRISITAVAILIAIGITSVWAKQTSSQGTSEATRFLLYPSHWTVTLANGKPVPFGGLGGRTGSGEYGGGVDISGALTISKEGTDCAYFPPGAWSCVLDQKRSN